MTTWHFCYKTPTLYLFAILFTLDNYITTLWWMYGTSTLPVRKRGDLYKENVFIYNTQEYVYPIAYFPFHYLFRSASQ